MQSLTKLAALSLVIFLFSCQKEASDDNLQQSASTDKVKTYTEDVTSTASGHSVTTFNVNYDASDRIISLISAADPGFKIMYSYPSANTIYSDLYIGGVLGIHNESYLVNNRIDSSFEYNDTNDSTTTKFVYNSSGNYIKTYVYDYSKLTGAVLENTITYTYDANGNQLTSEDTDGNEESYEYYTDMKYSLPVIGPPLVPVAKLNLVKTHTVLSNGYVLGTATFTYTFDSQNRISTEKGVTDDGSVVIKTYTYY